MSEEGEVQVTEEEVREATGMGWSDRDNWRGKPEDWVDAKTFLERSRQIMPLLRENNKRLQSHVSSLEARLNSLDTAVKAANTTIEALEASHADDVREQVEAARAALKEELTAALRDGDHDGAADITEKLTQLNTAEREADNKGGKTKGGNGEDKNPPVQIHPEVVQWYKDNPDFVNDRKRVALSNVVAVELRESGDMSTGKEFMDKVAQGVDEALGGAATSHGTSKVAPGGGGSQRRAPAGGGAKGYADLPQEAKDACDRMEKRLVGSNRAHKDQASWRASYAKQFFAQEK